MMQPPLNLNAETPTGALSPLHLDSAGNLLAHTAPHAATLVYGTATTAGATTIGTPPANSNLRKLVLAVTENATLAAAGENTISVLLDGVTVFTDQVYIPATALATNGVLYTRDLDFSDIAFGSGSAGTLTVNLGTALATGSLVVNGYFG